MSRKKVCLTSLGCPKNLVDSEVMLGILKNRGYRLTTEEAEADILIVNTCGFIGDAKEESIAAILKLAGYKKTGRCKILVVAGCLTQRYRQELSDELPEVDYLIGTGEYQNIADIIVGNRMERINIGRPTFVYDYDTPRLLSTPDTYAYVKVAEGCSNYCTYCTIPQIRGDFRSRPVESIVREARELASNGIKEINLIAQDTTSYGRDMEGDNGLCDLLRKLVGIAGVEWIRLLYLYPTRISDNLIGLIRDEEKICKYMDIPLQHIDPRILGSMNRHYTSTEIWDLIEKIRGEIADVVIRTSLIVGFPGEGDVEYEDLLSFVKKIRFDRLGVFRYSREEDTPAYGMEGQVPERIKEERYKRLMEAQAEISHYRNKKLVGRRLKVLVEGICDESEFLLQGRYWGQAPDVDGITYIANGTASSGDMVDLHIVNAGEYDLVGEVTGLQG